jgi:hypothetical protein
MANQEKVKDPNIEVSTKHIRPIIEEQWENRAPTDSQLNRIVTTITSLSEFQRKYEFSFGYDAYYMTVKNANNTSYMQKWINPQTPEEALDDTKDIKEKVSLVGHQGVDTNNKVEANLMVGSERLVEKYMEILKRQPKNAQFIVVTDIDKYGASSKTSRGDRLSNIDVVEIIPVDRIHSVEENMSLEEFEA